MRGKLLSLFIPVLAVSAIVGTGFALFQFNESEATSLEINKSNVDLAGYSEIGKIEIANTSYAKLSLDADDDQGIHLTYDNGATSATQDQVAFSFKLTQDTAAEEELTLTTVISMETNLGAYIDLSAQTYNDGSGIGTSSSQNPMTSTLTLTDTLSADGSGAETTFSLSTHLTFSWATDKEPDSKADWNTLSSIISNLTNAVTITYTVGFAD